jgi:hypothetical protein
MFHLIYDFSNLESRRVELKSVIMVVINNGIMSCRRGFIQLWNGIFKISACLIIERKIYIKKHILISWIDCVTLLIKEHSEFRRCIHLFHPTSHVIFKIQCDYEKTTLNLPPPKKVFCFWLCKYVKESPPLSPRINWLSWLVI